MATLPEPTDDQRFVTALFEQNGGQVYGNLLRLVRNKDDANDLLQDVWLKAFENAAVVREHENPIAWLMTVATNAAISFLRKKQFGQLADGAEGFLADPQWWRLKEKERLESHADLVADCVSRLDEAGRESLRAKLEGTQQDLADRLGKTIDAIYKLSSRAFDSVKQCVAGKLGKDGLSA